MGEALNKPDINRRSDRNEDHADVGRGRFGGHSANSPANDQQVDIRLHLRNGILHGLNGRATNLPRTKIMFLPST